jgi:hypothetical protein
MLNSYLECSLFTAQHHTLVRIALTAKATVCHSTHASKTLSKILLCPDCTLAVYKENNAHKTIMSVPESNGILQMSIVEQSERNSELLAHNQICQRCHSLQL